MTRVRGKLLTVVVVKCDDDLIERLDQVQRELEQATRAPFSRAVIARLLLEEALALAPAKLTRTRE